MIDDRVLGDAIDQYRADEGFGKDENIEKFGGIAGVGVGVERDAELGDLKRELSKGGFDRVISKRFKRGGDRCSGYY